MSLDWLSFMMIGGWPDGPPGGLLINIGLAVSCFLMGFIFAVPLALLRMAGGRISGFCATAFIEVLRSTPLILLLFWCHFLLPIMIGVNIPPLWSAFIALTLYSSAYQAEIVRAGFSSVPSGEVEAAQATGLSKSQVFINIVIPQGLRRMTPASASFAVSLFKDTAVIYVVGVIDLMQSGLIAAERNPNKMLISYLVMAAGFAVVGMVISLIGYKLENRLNFTRKVVSE